MTNTDKIEMAAGAFGRDYYEQRYPVAVAVRITWDDGMIHDDEIKGLNVGHALYLARRNWSDAASIEAVQ